MQTREPAPSRYPTLIIVSRAHYADDGQARYFYNLDGEYIDGFAPAFQRVVLLAPVFRKGIDAQYETKKSFTYQFHAPNIEPVEIPDSQGSRRLSVLLSTFWKQVRILWRVLRKNPDALVLLYFPTYRAAAMGLFCICLDRPYLVYSGTMWAETIRLSPRWAKKRSWYLPLYLATCNRLERVVYHRAKARLFFEATRLREYESIGATYRVRPGDRVKPAPSPAEHPLHKPARLLCAADLLPVKGHDVLYQALALLKKRGVTVIAILAGAVDNDWGPHLSELSKRLGITDMVHLSGWVADEEELRRLYDEADLFVLPSRSEGFPRVLHEAMARALPVITTNIPNIAAVLRHEQDVLLVPPDDPEALAAAIERLLADDALRRRLGEAGWRWLKDECSESDAEQFLRVVNRHT
ncbi:MAG TPA: glycosyltransferase family 4 protein [Verrucomicrobiae bacterium]|nr:glycosyltransferase family 4 protein [Verrucomicrobiae bacterium]